METPTCPSNNPCKLDGRLVADPGFSIKTSACTTDHQLPDVCTISEEFKPKLEPCQDVPTASDPAEDWGTTPLSGNPYFTTVLSRSQVQKPFQLGIPIRFQRRLPKARTATVLLCRNKSWSMSYCGDQKMKKFDAAWKDFAVDNQLRVGDACVFELMDMEGSKEMVFHVQILRGGLPEEVTAKGGTSDEPIVIVD